MYIFNSRDCDTRIQFWTVKKSWILLSVFCTAMVHNIMQMTSILNVWVSFHCFCEPSNFYRHFLHPKNIFTFLAFLKWILPYCMAKESLKKQIWNLFSPFAEREKRRQKRFQLYKQSRIKCLKRFFSRRVWLTLIDINCEFLPQFTFIMLCNYFPQCVKLPAIECYKL